MPKVRTEARYFNYSGAIEPRQSFNALAAEIGPTVYAVRTPDRLVKIGYTRNIAQRIKPLGCTKRDVLLVQSGDMDYEKSLHRKFRIYVARGNEYYFPTREIIDWINAQRAEMRLKPITF